MNKKESILTRFLRKFSTRTIVQRPILWKKFIKGLLGIGVSIMFFQLALFWAQLTVPLQKYSLLVLAISLLILYFSIRSIWHWLQSITVYNLLKYSISFYIISVFVMAISTTGEDGFVQALFRSSVQVPTIALRYSYNSFLSILNYPYTFSKVYNSRNPNTSSDFISANESETINLTSLDIIMDNKKSNISPGMNAIMDNKANEECNLDTMSDEAFFESKSGLIIEGPQYKFDKSWWRLRNEAGSAWCPNDVILTRP